jgi:hypothetical protein
MSKITQFKNQTKQFLPAIFTILPLITFWIFWLYHPAYWFSTDPAAWYFLDSLAPFAQKPYTYVDHPGTPLHLIGTIILGITYPFLNSQETFLQYHIEKPEFFFVAANFFLLILNISTVTFFYYSAFSNLKQNRVLASTAISLMYFGIHPHGFHSLIYWSHNSFNFIFGTLWLLWLYRALQKEERLGWTTITAFGFSAGAISMTQLYLLAWLIGGIVIVFVFTFRVEQSIKKSVQKGSIFLLGGLAGIVSMLIPISGQLTRMFDWMMRLLGSSGIYGVGEKSFYSLDLIPLSIQFWVEYIPLLMLFLGLALFALTIIIRFTQKKQISFFPSDFAMLIGLSVQTLVLIVILAKFFYRIRYTLALAAIVPVLIFILIKILENRSQRFVLFKQILYTGIIASACIFMVDTMQSQQKRDFVEKDAARARSIAVNTIAQSKQISKNDVITVYGFGTPLKCAGLLAANNWIRAFDKEIENFCPNQYALYDFSFEVNLNLIHPLPNIEEIDWDLVVFPGTGPEIPAHLEAVGAKNIPGSWGIERSKWFYIRGEP